MWYRHVSIPLVILVQFSQVHVADTYSYLFRHSTWTFVHFSVTWSILGSGQCPELHILFRHEWSCPMHKMLPPTWIYLDFIPHFPLPMSCPMRMSLQNPLALTSVIESHLQVAPLFLFLSCSASKVLCVLLRAFWIVLYVFCQIYLCCT